MNNLSFTVVRSLKTSVERMEGKKMAIVATMMATTDNQDDGSDWAYNQDGDDGDDDEA